MSDVQIEPMSQLTPELVEAVGALMPQLRSGAPPSTSELAQVAASPATVWLVARQEARIIGMLTLILVRVPSSMRAIIEDVVVARSHHGQGIGEALMHAALARAQSAGARSVDLTCHPSREAATRLYQRLGFAHHDTRTYRFSFDRAR